VKSNLSAVSAARLAKFVRCVLGSLRFGVHGAQQVLGIERVLYAMDYPYQFVPEEVKVTDELPISEEERVLLYQRNAERLFRLK